MHVTDFSNVKYSRRFSCTLFSFWRGMVVLREIKCERRQDEINSECRTPNILFHSFGNFDMKFLPLQLKITWKRKTYFMWKTHFNNRRQSPLVLSSYLPTKNAYIFMVWRNEITAAAATKCISDNYVGHLIELFHVSFSYCLHVCVCVCVFLTI